MSILRPSIVVGLMVSLALPNATILNFGGRGLVDSAYAQDSLFESKKIVPYVPSPEYVVDKMIELAGVKKGDVVYDLGSGDGRIVIAAAKKGAKAVGFEIDPDLVGESRANIQKGQLKPGSRIVSHSFDMGDWKPDKVERVEGRTIYFWTVPAKGR